MDYKQVEAKWHKYWLDNNTYKFNKDRVKTNAESLVGKQAIVISEIDNLQGIGQVTVGGQEWSARTTRDGITLPVGSVVIIRAISGVKLLVEEMPEQTA